MDSFEESRERAGALKVCSHRRVSGGSGSSTVGQWIHRVIRDILYPGRTKKLRVWVPVLRVEKENLLDT